MVVHKVEGLAPATTYMFCTFATTAYFADTSIEYCSDMTTQTTHVGAPLPPTDLDVTYQQRASIVQLSWGPPKDNGGVLLAHYEHKKLLKFDKGNQYYLVRCVGSDKYYITSDCYLHLFRYQYQT